MGETERQISELAQQLEQLGYYRHQIDNIIKDVTGTTKISDISTEQATEIIAQLEGQVQFALRCLRTKV